MKGQAGTRKNHQDDLAEVMKLIQSKKTERDRVLALYRRGRVDDQTLDKQMDEIGVEEQVLQDRIKQLTVEMEGAKSAETTLASTAELLQKLNRRLDEPLSRELKRQLVELLVEEVRVDTIDPGGKRESRVTVTYRFPTPQASIDNRTGARAGSSGIRGSRASAPRTSSYFTEGA